MITVVNRIPDNSRNAIIIGKQDGSKEWNAKHKEKLSLNFFQLGKTNYTFMKLGLEKLSVWLALYSSRRLATINKKLAIERLFKQAQLDDNEDYEIPLIGRYEI